MKKKNLTNLRRRVTAFILAFLMLLSLLPVNTNVALAADEYSFNITDGTNAIVDTEVKFYETVDEVTSLVATGTTDAEGKIVISGLTFEDTKEIIDGNTYAIECHGYKNGTVTIDDATETDKEYEIILEEYPQITVSGTVQLPEGEGENRYAGINIALYEKILDGEERLVDDTIDVNDASGAYSFENVLAGYTYIIKITADNNAYATKEIEVNLVDAEEDYKVPIDDENILVAKTDIELVFPANTVVYIEGTEKTVEPTVSGATEGAYSIDYKLKDDTLQNISISVKDSKNLVVSATEGAIAGDVIIVATLTGDAYVKKEIEFIVKIAKKTINSTFNFKDSEITNGGEYEVAFDGAFDATAIVTDGKEENIQYSSDNEKVVIFEGDDGKVTIKGVGIANITATLPADGDYTLTEISLKLTVKTATQSKAPEFTNTWGNEYTFNENNNVYDFGATTSEANATISSYVAKVVKDNGDGSVTKEENCDFIEIDEYGKLTVKKAGTYEISAIATKENYEDEVITRTLKINLADPQIAFNKEIENFEEKITNGAKLLNSYDFVEADLQSELLGDDVDTGVTYKVSYSVNDKDAVDLGIVSVDKNDGTVTFEKLKAADAGNVTVTITATRADDGKYKESSTSYSFMVNDWEPERFSDLYKITGVVGENEWFTTVDNDNPINVTVTNTEKYAIFGSIPSTQIDVDAGSDSISKSTWDEGKNNTISFCIMDKEEGYISKWYTVKGIKVDTVAPSVYIEKYDAKYYENSSIVVWLLSFFKQETNFEVKIGESPNGSAETTYYYLSNSAVALTEDEIKTISENDWRRLEGTTVTLPNNSKGVIYVKVVDEAGHISYAHTKGLIADNIAPKVTTTTDVVPYGEFYSSDFTINVAVDDGDSSSGIKEITYYINNGEGVPVLLKDTDDKKVVPDEKTTENQLYKKYDFDIDIDADAYNTVNGVTINVEVEDNNGYRESYDFLYRVYIPAENEPSISLSYEDAGSQFEIDKIPYFGESRTATIKIESPSYVFNEDGVVVEVNGSKLTNLEWNTDNQTVEVPFEKTGRYEVSIDYTDKAGNEATKVTDTFVIDMTDPTVNLTVDAPHINEIYNKDFNVQINVDDTVVTSGLKEVTYSVKCDDVVTKTETWTLSNKKPSALKDIHQTKKEAIIVSAKDNNSSNVVVEVKATDYFDNTTTVKTAELNIDATTPKIEVSYADQDTTPNIVGDKGYFDKGRTATITVTERETHFDKEEFMKNIKITATDAKGNDVKNAVEIISAETIPGATENDAKHIFTIKYTADANYTFSASCTDKAGLTCTDKNITSPAGTVTPKNFAIDTKLPTGSIKVADLGVWYELLEKITFGLWSPSDVDIEMTADDATSPIASIQYYKTSTFTPLGRTELDAVTTWTDYSKFSVSKDDIFVIYGKITDNAGHVEYISSNGIVVDESKPVFETFSPEITLSPQQPVNGIYNDDVTVDVKVVDPKKGENNAYSGLKEIRYEVYNMGEKTQSGTLYKFNKEDPTQNQLKQSWDAKDIVVDAEKNNSNKVVVKVFATDNAGNNSNKSVSLKIDMTSPIIEVSYDNNEGDTTFEDNVYYNSKRVATIKVTERNFDAEKVKVTITNSDGKVPKISEWKTKKGTGNGDDAVHTATITYKADGDYTFKVSMKDKAGNANKAVKYGDSQAPKAFTIDKTKPVISVSYDNNEAMNDNYYKADRTATITIQEHNFDESRVEATITATDNGENVAVPSISRWSKSGDTYTATINYTDDAMYTFALAYTDMAGNEAEAIDEQTFYVDKTAPVMSIKGVVDETTNNADTIGFVITATDTNFDVFTPVLTATVKTKNGFSTKELDIAAISKTTNGSEYKVTNIDADGIYRITCTLIDKAGNAYTDITLYEEDGSSYVENRTAEDTLLSFSVNRDGSVFEVDESTAEILENYYVHDIQEDITIIEVNANRLSEQKITLNGETLKEGKDNDYTVRVEGEDGTWKRYIYTIKKELFAEEGEYIIVVSSVDEAENNAFSDVKDTKVSFVVDRTAPVVTIAGMENGGRYQTDNQTVTLIPTDDGGEIRSIVIYQVDKDGNIIGEPLMPELSGDELIEKLEANDGMIEFQLPKGNYEYIEVVCSDNCVNDKGESNVARIRIEDVRISASVTTLYMPDLVAPIAIGSVVVVAAVAAIVINKKKRSNKIK